jgi:hypothetical protein
MFVKRDANSLFSVHYGRMVGVLDDMWCGHTNAHGDMHGERPAKHSLRRIDEARRLTALSQFRCLRQRRVFVVWYAHPGLNSA